MKIKANGIDINYEIEGSGPWLTMSHSLACDLHMWDPQMPVLTKRFKVLRFDTRGHGQSAAPAGDYTLEQMAVDVKGLFDGLGIRQTHWAGLSMGGMIGQAFALRYPGVFQSLVLADTTSRRPPDAAKMWSDRIETAKTKGMDALVESTLARWFTEPYRNSRKDVMQRIAKRIADLGWHIVIYFEHADLDEMGPFLTSLPTALVFDHMACPNVKEGVDGKHFQNWLKALDANKNWITKVTCPERFTVAGPPYDDVVPFAKAIVDRFPDRVIWGTDWPHPNMPKEAPDDGVIVDMIPKIATTPELQRKLLVDNPMKLYWA